MGILSIAVPNKGRLSKRSVTLLNAIGFGMPEDPGRTLVMNIGKGRYKVLFARADDIPEFVENQVVDIGITGLDLVEESERDVERLLDLEFGECRLVVAAPEDSKIGSVEDIPDESKIATSFPGLTERFFKKMKKRVEIVPMTGATELAPHIGVADLISDLTETGSTLKMNRLKEIGVILDSQAVMIVNRNSLKEKEEQIEEIRSAVLSVLNAKRRRYLMANVPKSALEQLTALLPSMSGPTVMNIIGRDDVIAVHAVVDEAAVNGVVTLLKTINATGILVLPIERLIP